MTVVALLLAASINFSGLDLTRPTDKELIEAYIQYYGYKYKIDPILIKAVIKVESNFRVRAIGSSHGEVGLMQLHPRFFKHARFEIGANIGQGVAHLAYVKNRCQLRYGKAWFICYNTGVSVSIKQPLRHEYYKRVNGVYKNYAYRLRESSSKNQASL